MSQQLAIISSNQNMGVESKKLNLPPLPLNVWLKIFDNLTRNDLDNCQLVCRLWRCIIYNNAKFLPKRAIEYLILSTSRCFSIQICSEQKIKVFTFQKYFTRENMWININDRRLMAVQTIHKNDDNKELFTVTGGAHRECIRNMVDRGSIVKRRYKIHTAPVLFFKILRSLLIDVGEIKQLVFQKFTFTDAFLEKMMYYTDLPLRVNQALYQEHRRRDGRQARGPSYVYFITELIQENRQPPKEPATRPAQPAPGQAPQPQGQMQAMLALMRNRMDRVRQAQGINIGAGPVAHPNEMRMMELEMMHFEQLNQRHGQLDPRMRAPQDEAQDNNGDQHRRMGPALFGNRIRMLNLDEEMDMEELFMMDQ